MRGRVSKPRACRSRLNPPKASQEKRLDAIASTTQELLLGREARSPAGRGVTQGTTPLQSSKRPLDAASTNDTSPAKRARFTRAGVPRGPSRRSVRLQGQQSASRGDPIHPSRASFERQIDADAWTSPSTRPGSTRRNPQPQAEDQQLEQTIGAVQHPKPPRRPSTSLLEAGAVEQGRVSPAAPPRKQQIDGSDNERQLKPARLTRENLAELDKMGRKGATKTSASAPSESTIGSTTTKATSTTTSGFAIQAYENGILDPLSSKPPTNIENIRTRYAQSRGTASPTESMYEDYVDTVERACNEATMVVEVSGQLLKKYPRDGYNRVFNQAFTNFPKDVGFNNGLSAPQPDYVEGLEMPDYRPFLVYKYKARGKDMDKTRLQSAYDGAALVYARNQALSYIGKPDPPGHAEVTTFTTDGTNLNLFAHYAAPSEDGTIEYHQYLIKSTSLIDSYQGLKDGRRGLRNEQDYARKQSYAMRDQLKERWKQQSSALQYFHRHSDGKVTWLEDCDDEN